MWKQFELRFAPILGLLFLLFSFDSAFKFGTAFTLGCASRITLADLQGLNPRASAKGICGRPRGVRLGVHVFAVIWSSGAIVTDEDEMGLRLVASYADAFFEVDPDAQHVIANHVLHSKCGWTPFAGVTVWGRVQRVVLRGALAYNADDPDRMAQPGSGRLVPAHRE